MENLSFFGIVAQVNSLEQNLYDSLGEINENTEKNLDTLKIALIEKTDNVARWMHHLESEKKRLAKDISELKEKEVILSNALTRFEDYVGNCMAMMEKKSIEGQSYIIKRRAPSEVVVIEDEDQLPIELLNRKEVVTVTPDKTAIKNLLKGGSKVPGAILGKGKESVKFERR